jgi:hypothetical protein
VKATARIRGWSGFASALLGLWLSIAAHAQPASQPAAAPEAGAAGPAREIEWQDLLPAEERDTASLVPPTAVHDYLLGESTPPPGQADSSGINPDLADRVVRLPGFIVPLEIDRQGRVTELFLVPFYGACIHVPPPPPNQIVHVTMAEPLTLGSMTAAYWMTGQMRIATRHTRLGTAAYSMHAAHSEEYEF